MAFWCCWPPSLQELQAFPNVPDDLFSILWQGSYPRIYDRGIPSSQWLADYITTYVERDVRQVVNVGNLQLFSSFLKLCAGRTAQEVNLSTMGNDLCMVEKNLNNVPMRGSCHGAICRC